jgi:catechol 2,3-dioxygenase-like lactoylglutathione lyase family enzyme
MEWRIEVVVIPVSDEDRAKRFYSEQVGFVVDTDTRLGDSMRVVQLTPPGSACSITIGTGLADMPPGSVKGVQMVVEDIAAARAELAARGVAVSEIQHFEQGARLDGPGGRLRLVRLLQRPRRQRLGRPAGPGAKLTDLIGGRP